MRLLDMVGLADIASSNAATLPEGQRKLTDIAIALALKPRLLLLDEPTNGLDVMGTRTMRTIIRQMRAAGKCVLFSSHIMQEVSALCDRIVIISAGRIVAQGTPGRPLGTKWPRHTRRRLCHADRHRRGGPMNAVFAVLRKELIDGLRDRRSMMSAILFPMIGPLLISFMATTATERQRESRDVKIPIVGAEQAPGLVNWIERRGYQVVEGPLDPEAAVRDGAVDFVLIVTEDFASNLTEARTAVIELVLDGTKKDAVVSIGHAYSLVESYGHMSGPTPAHRSWH